MKEKKERKEKKKRGRSENGEEEEREKRREEYGLSKRLGFNPLSLSERRILSFRILNMKRKSNARLI